MATLNKSNEANLGEPQSIKKGLGSLLKNAGKAGWNAIKQEANRQGKRFSRSAQNGTVAQDYGLDKPVNAQDTIPGQEQAQPGIIEQMGNQVINAGINGAVNNVNNTSTGRTITTAGSILSGVIQVAKANQPVEQPDTTITEDDIRMAELELGHNTTDSLRTDSLNNQARVNQVEVQRFQQQQEMQPQVSVGGGLKR